MKQVVGVSQARLGGVGSLREGTSASSREGNGIGEPGRGTEWVAGRARGETQSRVLGGERGAKWGNGGSRMVLGAVFPAQTTTASTDSTTPKEGSMTVLNTWVIEYIF